VLRISLTLAIVAASGLAQNAKQAAPASQATVEMGVFDYRPEGVSIKAGQTVRFINNSTSTHNVTDLPRPSKDTGSPHADQLPSGEKSFDSGDIDPQRSWEYRFNTPGTYRFHCRYHDKDGMSGVVTVVK
jgi:plastocyanin